MKEIKLIFILLSFWTHTYSQDMKGMDMSKKENATQAQPAIYTCVMHPEIHAGKELSSDR